MVRDAGFVDVRAHHRHDYSWTLIGPSPNDSRWRHDLGGPRDDTTLQAIAIATVAQPSPPAAPWAP